MQKIVLDLWMIKNGKIIYDIRYLGIVLDGIIYAKCYSFTSVIDSNFITIPLNSVDAMQPLNKEILYYTLRVNIDDDDPLKKIEHTTLEPDMQKDITKAFYAITPYLSRLKRKFY